MLRLVLAAPELQYVDKLSRYLRESEPRWRIATFTQEIALLRHLEERPEPELLLLHSSFIRELRAKADMGRWGDRIVALAEAEGEGEGAPEIAAYQPLSRIRAELTAFARGGKEKGGGSIEGASLLTVFSASGGCGKTALALNIARLAGERGKRVFYLNLEALNASDVLWRGGEPDSLSRLLYAMRARPDRGAEEWGRLRRNDERLRFDYLDAPDHPGERIAMSAEQLRELVAAIRSHGKYDLIVADPDCGCGDWHLELLNASDRVAWIVLDDVLSMRKTEKLVRHWRDKLPADRGHTAFVVNKYSGAMRNGWRLPGGEPAGRLPYIPQWKTVNDPEQWLASPVFGGAVDKLLDEWGFANSGAGSVGGAGRW
ncbi:hypothetical protein [Cohnella massiliensis]|uniref:hypothetical protein n=1 Tax=Cohnella massiliensis TaxID=1816691 RepID=UPI0009BC373A|nr:hypothetical protein [Cohnella massiliensis]